MQTALAQTPLFTPANDSANLHYTHTLNSNTRQSRRFGTGPAACDYDKDGKIDVFIPQAFGFPNELYRNNGDGTFVEVAAFAGVAGLSESRAALWIDYDNDGWLDLFVANDPDAPEGQIEADPNTTSNSLYRNQHDGTFLEVSEAAGVRRMPSPETSQTVGGLAAADINNDGFVDIYVSCWDSRNALFLNNGDGTFSEIGLSAGVFEPGFSWTPMFHDINRDGLIDLLLNMDFTQNRLLINQGNNTFVDVAGTTEFASAFNEMGMTLGDYDNDGDFDVLATNIELPYPDVDPLSKWSVLLDNTSTVGGLNFEERGLAAGVGRTGWGWGCTFFDADNDGRIDLAVTNGFHETGPYVADPSRLFHNLGASQFAEISNSAGFSDTLSGRGLIAFDYDSDGDLDLLENNYGAPATLFRNDTAGAGRWLTVDLLAAGSGNHFAIGAEITLTAAALTQMRLVTAGTSFLSQEPYRQMFGLGSAETVESMSVRWPDGTVEIIAGSLPADRAVRIRQGLGLLADGDLDADGDVDFDDLGLFVGCMNGPDTGLGVGCGAANADRDRDVDLLDFSMLSLNAGP